MSTHIKHELLKSADPVVSKGSQVPANWPEDVIFLHDQTYTDAVTPELRTALSRTTAENSSYPKITPDEVNASALNVSVRLIDDPSHPARGQRGLFAARHLIPDAFILLYLGEVHCNSLSDTDPHSDYDLSLDRDIGLSIDGARSGNESRFANDYRGVAERPNAEFRDCFVRVPSTKRADGTKWERRVAIYVLSAGKAGKRKAGIREGEEILVSYGKGYWEGRKLLGKFRKDEEMARIAQAAMDAE